MRVVRHVHPKKDIRRAISVLEEAGWSVVLSKGRSSHAWGRAHCPFGHRECSVSIWSTPASPSNHAANLVARVAKCHGRVTNGSE